MVRQSGIQDFIEMSCSGLFSMYDRTYVYRVFTMSTSMLTYTYIHSDILTDRKDNMFKLTNIAQNCARVPNYSRSR